MATRLGGGIRLLGLLVFLHFAIIKGILEIGVLENHVTSFEKYVIFDIIFTVSLAHTFLTLSVILHVHIIHISKIVKKRYWVMGGLYINEISLVL